MPSRKIVTCCYCGTRAALVLTGKERHELSCASCGAPLHDLKMLRADHRGKPERVGPARRDKPKKAGKKAKKPKSVARRLLGEAFDILDDIFD